MLTSRESILNGALLHQLCGVAILQEIDRFLKWTHVRCRDDTLPDAVALQELEKGSRSASMELSEDTVHLQHRASLALVVQVGIPGELHRHSEGPMLPLRGVTPDEHGVQSKHQLVAVGPDQR